MVPGNIVSLASGAVRTPPAWQLATPQVVHGRLCLDLHSLH